MLNKSDIHEDVLIPTQCSRCYAQCGIKVRRVNGVVVKIEGVPETTLGSEGGLCGKGLAGIQVLYDPNRLDKPLRRTNPEKGLYADPRWKEISWKEAIDEIVDRLKKVLPFVGNKEALAVEEKIAAKQGVKLDILGQASAVTSQNWGNYHRTDARPQSR